MDINGGDFESSEGSKEHGIEWFYFHRDHIYHDEQELVELET